MSIMCPLARGPENDFGCSTPFLKLPYKIQESLYKNADQNVIERLRIG